jgi:predicted nucleic acid-binding protein
MAVETAVLDACVLFSGGTRDFLLWIAEAGAFSPAWSDAIHDEWMRSRRDKLGDPPARLAYARAEMEKAFPGASFDSNAERLKGIALPDESDAHVLATAISAAATTIVTYNIRHFPKLILAPLGLSAQTPDALCTRLFREAQDDVIEGARLHRASLRRPSYDPDGYLQHLASLKFRRTAQLLAAHKTVI